MFAVMYAAQETARDVLLAVAREFSPRLELCDVQQERESGCLEVVLDLGGLQRLFGDVRTIAAELRRTAAARGLRVRLAIAATCTAARVLVRHRAGVTVIDAGTEAATLAPVPLSVLAMLGGGDAADDLVRTLRRWGIRTCGDLAALPAEALAARLGQQGVHWQRLARGEDARPIVPTLEEERFEHALDLEWPIEGLEPLSFVLGRVLEPLTAHLERRHRAAAVLHVRLHLVSKVVHARALQLPAPVRDARTLRTLALLDLESHPPAAAIDRVMVAVDPTPERVVQYSLVTRPVPSGDQRAALLARLGALMGEGRCGSPAEQDSWQPGAFAMKPFNPVEVVHLVEPMPDAARTPVVALRRLRFPVPARVRVEQGKPARVMTDRRDISSGDVVTCAGPWRTSGAWWASVDASTPPWDRDEWDVALADGTTYRMFRDRGTGAWFVEGMVD